MVDWALKTNYLPTYRLNASVPRLPPVYVMAQTIRAIDDLDTAFVISMCSPLQLMPSTTTCSESWTATPLPHDAVSPLREAPPGSTLSARSRQLKARETAHREIVAQDQTHCTQTYLQFGQESRDKDCTFCQDQLLLFKDQRVFIMQASIQHH